jgi:hypothetical protein
MMMATRVRAAQAGVEAWLQRPCHLVANGRASVRTAYSEVYAEPPQRPHRLREVPEGVPRPPYVRANCHAMPCHAMPCHAKLHLNHCTSLPRFITTSLTNEQTGRLPDTCMLTRPQPSSRHSGSEFVCMHAHMVLQRSRHNTTASELTDSSFSSCASRTYPHASRSRIMHVRLSCTASCFLMRVSHCLAQPHVCRSHACLSLPHATAYVALTTSQISMRVSHSLT